MARQPDENRSVTIRRTVRPRNSAIGILAVLTVAIFATELTIMAALFLTGVTLPNLAGAVLDSVILTLVLYPVLYLLVYRPLSFEIAQREGVEEELRRAYDELEMRVQERTADLAKANEGLQAEVAERKQAEEERERVLKEAETQRRFLQLILDNAPVGIAVVRVPDLIYEYVNPAYQQFFLPGVEVVGRPLGEGRMTPEELAQSLERVMNTLRTGEPHREVDRPYHVRLGPGAPIEERFVTSINVPLRGAEGEADRALILSMITTEQVLARRRVEELAQVAHRRAAELQAIIDNMVDAVAACDTEGRITIFNEAGLRLAGIERPEETLPNLRDIPQLVQLRRSTGEIIPPEETLLSRALRGETIKQEDGIIYNPLLKRDLFVRSSAAPIRDEEGKIIGAVSVTRDVTELVELERLKDQFISVAAHELKTPVTGIKGYAQLLLKWEHEGVSPRGLKALGVINRQTDRISRLVNELLEVSRIQAGRLELHLAKVDLSELVAELVERSKLTTEKHNLLFQSPGPVFVEGDSDRIEQVVNTLLDNAIKFSTQGGDIQTGVRVVDGEAVVSVRDYGVGIPREKQAHIFERFFRAHAGTPYDFGGMGVGLFISKEIIAAHGGRMWFESEEGKGSTFYFSLPLA